MAVECKELFVRLLLGHQHQRQHALECRLEAADLAHPCGMREEVEQRLDFAQHRLAPGVLRVGVAVKVVLQRLMKTAQSSQSKLGGLSHGKPRQAHRATVVRTKSDISGASTGGGMNEHGAPAAVCGSLQAPSATRKRQRPASSRTYSVLGHSTV